jgi:hypothetical protein
VVPLKRPQHRKRFFGAIGAAYLTVSAAGSGTAGTVQAFGAATGWTTATETGAEAVSTVTSVSGFGTLLATGNMNKAATAAAWEGIVTSNPKDLATGGTFYSRRPHSSLGYLTPDEFARQWKAASLSGAKSMAVDQPCQGNPDGLRFAPDLTRLLPGQEIST